MAWNANCFGIQGDPKYVSILLSISLHIKLAQASVFQVNYHWSSKVLFTNFNGSSSRYNGQERIKIAEDYVITKLISQTNGKFRRNFP